jgi:hypothetical protein
VSAQHPIKAKPVKTGDAKLWVYRRESCQDCQAAEDHKTKIVIVLPGLSKPGFFIGWPHPTMQTRIGSGMQIKRRKTMFRNLKVLLIAVFVLAIAGSAYAFAASNTVPASAAGAGATTVSGYTITDLVYDLDATDSTLVDAITFTVTPDASGPKALSVFVQTAAAGAWSSCTLADATPPVVNATCTFGSLAVADVTALNIVASSTTDPAP